MIGAETDTRALPGRPVSLWLDGAEVSARPPLEHDLEVDVAVIGAGIIGLTAGLELRRRGATVAVLEGRSVAAGVSGNTTAKLSSLHGLSYGSISSTHGERTARVYAEANEWGIERVGQIAAELGIECDLRRKPNLTYTEDSGRIDEIEAEVDAARTAGLAASFTDTTDLPFEIAGAIKLDDQAEFHPVAYLRGVAAALESEGGRIYERTRATGVSCATVATEGGPEVCAAHVVVATHLPFLDRGLFFARAQVMRSYATSVRVAGEPPKGMYLQAESPGRSLRSVRWEGEELLIVGGESHELGWGDPVKCFAALEHYARERFEVVRFEHRWSAHDYMPEDGLPYIGRAWPFSDRVLTANGMRKWGLAMGTAAAGMLADQVSGEDNDWTSTFDPRRLPPLSSASQLAKHNAGSGIHFFADRVRRGGGVAELAPGEGRVVGDGLRQKAVHRDETGTLHAVSARCTHLGCIVGWNAAEQTWDCPCHGSRFEATGEVANGPAVRPLQPEDPPDDE